MITQHWIGVDNNSDDGNDESKYQNLEHSLVFLLSCAGAGTELPACFFNTGLYGHPLDGNPKGADFFISPHSTCFGSWGIPYAYYFFHYMMYGHDTDPFAIPGCPLPEFSTHDYPMTAKESYDTLKKHKVDPDP